MFTPLAAVAALLLHPQGTPGRIPLDPAWELSGEGSRIETHLGRRAIRLRNGFATRHDVVFEDGTIEFDLDLMPHRTFVYLQFRMQSDTAFEGVYLRAHKNELPDALQYEPVWNGEGSWQLFHGPGATAPAVFVYRQWMHVRLEVSGQRAALFVGTSRTPALVMALQRHAAPGYLALRAFTPPGSSPEGEVAASFSNVTVRPGVVTYAFGPPPAAPALPAGMVTRWQLSAPFPADSGAMLQLPASLLATRADWPSFGVEPGGLLALGRHLHRPAAQSGAIARLVVRADAAGLQRLRLGFSDWATVYLNERPLFAADAHYSFDAPRLEGLIGLYQASVWLPLTAGDNELLIAIVDRFGGWGLMAQLDPTPGVRLVP
jgi:hypothetical protein